MPEFKIQKSQRKEGRGQPFDKLRVKSRRSPVEHPRGDPGSTPMELKIRFHWAGGAGRATEVSRLR